MKYSNVFFIFTLVLLFGSTGAQAGFKWSACKAVFSKDDCRVYQHAYKTLNDLMEAKKTIDDLQRQKDELLKQNAILLNDVKVLTIKGNELANKTTFLSAVTQVLVKQNRSLKTEAIRYRKFIRMFKAENH